MSDTPFEFLTGENAMSEYHKSYDSNHSMVHYGKASQRSFLNEATNISVRGEGNKRDFEYYHTSYNITNNPKDLFLTYQKAYEKVSIVKNVVDIMGEFGCKGIRLEHSNKQVENLANQWFSYVNGPERSERFLNMLYRLGTVPIHRVEDSVDMVTEKKWRAVDGKINTEQKVKSRTLPVKYYFVNPALLEVEDPQLDVFTGSIQYKIRVDKSLSSKLISSVPDLIPSDLLRRISKNSNQGYLPLSSNDLSVYYYKKDDWIIWPKSIIYAILDDLVMMERMKLADMAALDGAISNIRLWTLGIIDPTNPANNILPTPAGIARLRNILAQHVGAGTLDLVWGPELKFTESNTQVYKFLGSEKYVNILNSIYDGLGVPSTLRSGVTDTSTNNFTSLKTMIERLEYGRGILVNFWKQELQRFAQAFNLSTPPVVTFSDIILSDETAEKKLWIDLLDRDVVDLATFRRRFRLNNSITSKRINSERKKRGVTIPEKASPYHDPHHKDKMKLENKKVVKQGQNIGSPNDGRPRGVKETTKRKPKPLAPSNASLISWATTAQMQINNILVSTFLLAKNKKSLRSCSSKEREEFETIKFSILCQLRPYSEITEEIVYELLDNSYLSKEAVEILNSMKLEYVTQSGREPTVDELRNIQSVIYGDLNG